MVQYGGGLPSGGRNHPFRTIRPPRLNLRNLLLLLIAFFVLRNLLRNDYQKEGIQYLRDSKAETQQRVPQTALIQGKDEELRKMKEDIAYLLKELEELKTNQASSKHKTSDSGRGASLTSMDELHEEKRKMKEAQLLKENPDFKPSKRLKNRFTEKDR